MPLADNPVYPKDFFSVKRCFADSFRAWIENVWLFWGVSFVAVILGMASFTVLNGALYGGFMLMLLETMDGGKPRFAEIFTQLRRFFPLFAAFWFTIILTVAGTILLVLPGIFLGTSCFYLLILAVDRGISFDEAFVESRKAVKRYGFWRHFLLGLILLFIPIIGTYLVNGSERFIIQAAWTVVLVLLLPFVLGLLVSAYRQTLKAEEEKRKRFEQEFEYMRDELETAHDMQMSLLPREMPRIRGYEIAGVCIPANHVGGDYFAWRWLDGDRKRLAVVMADVSGKAMVAAVIAVRFNEMLRYELKDRRKPSDILLGLHHSLTGQVEEGTFITCCAATLDTEDGTVEIANAGHCHPFHYSVTKDTVTSLEINGFALGMPSQFLKEEPYDTTRFKMEAGDVVLFYTDGVVDAENVRGEFYDEAGVRLLFQSREEMDTAQKIVDRTVQSVKEFCRGAPQKDDISIVALKRGNEQNF
ncbi:MAG: serine/threonine-protein phosphatase [Acidobacteria bacterium]|nr:serine/threonine-protein phosphatase [Acidobacteriota bacterium]